MTFPPHALFVLAVLTAACAARDVPAVKEPRGLAVLVEGKRDLIAWDTPRSAVTLAETDCDDADGGLQICEPELREGWEVDFGSGAPVHIQRPVLDFCSGAFCG